MLGVRPKLNPGPPKSIRLYPALEAIISAEAKRLGCSDNEVIIAHLENDLLRMATYRLSYADGIALMTAGQSESCPTNGPVVLQNSKGAA